MGPSRKTGVISFEVARDVTDPSCVLALEAFEDPATLERQEEQPEVARAMELFETGALVAEPEYTIYDVSPGVAKLIGWRRCRDRARS